MATDPDLIEGQLQLMVSDAVNRGLWEVGLSKCLLEYMELMGYLANDESKKDVDGRKLIN